MLLPSPLSPLRLHVSMHLAESGWTQGTTQVLCGREC